MKIMTFSNVPFFSFENTSKRGKPVLDLSTNSLSPKPCHILGKVIATDRTFLEYKFADCMLSEDGMYYNYHSHLHM